MVIRSRDRGRVEVRTAEFGSSDPWLVRLASAFSTSGVTVTDDKVFGLPTATYCIRLVSMNIAQSELMVADVTNPKLPLPRPDTWQYQLLHNPPADELTGFNLIADISSSIEGFGNACLQKIKVGRPGVDGEVADLRPLDMEKVRIYQDSVTDQKLFDLYLPNGTKRTTDCSEILHIRGWNPKGGLVGMSPIQNHRASLGNFLAQTEFLGRFFRNNATPSGYISLPDGAEPDPKEVAEMIAEWEDTHGSDNNHRVALLSNGAEWKQVGINLSDIAFLDGQRFAVEEMARMLFVPHGWVTPTTADKTRTVEESLIQLVGTYLRPRCDQIESALNADPDLFPAGGKIEMSLNLGGLIKGDALSESQKILRYRQGGIWSANEARVATGMPPIDDPEYDKPLILPVGAGAIPGSELPADGSDAVAGSGEAEATDSGIAGGA
ncbi:MAG: phage portal protein [Mycobacteriales bacterium]